jgi:hypothetical protein
MLESGLGQGTFVADPYARNPYFAWAVSIVPAYYPIPALTLALHAKLAQELTQSDVDTYHYQPVFYDMQARVRYTPPTIPVAEINSVVEVRVYMPTSEVSRYETLILGAMARWAFFRTFGPIVIAYGGSFRKNFHQYQSPVLDAGKDPMIYSRVGGAEDLRGSNTAIAGNNVSYAIQNALSLSYVPLAKLAISLSYGMANAWTYKVYPEDDMTSPYADGGRGQRDTAFGGLDLWYRFDQRFSLSAGVFTSASPKTDDNQSYRFPFYDFTSTASNLTMFYLALTVTEFLGG